MYRKKQRIAFCLFLIAFVCGQNEQALTLDKSTDAKTLAGGQSAYYSIVVPQNIAENSQFLIFDVFAASDDASNPDIYISDVF